MKEYIVPNMEIITLETEDVITTSSISGGCSGGGGGPFDAWCVIGISDNEFSICSVYDDGCDSWGDTEAN